MQRDNMMKSCDLRRRPGRMWDWFRQALSQEGAFGPDAAPKYRRLTWPCRVAVSPKPRKFAIRTALRCVTKP